MPKRIEKLTLSSFRGSSNKTELLFDSTKPVTLIFGENGTGKSSIVDSIDFVCSGKLGSLAFRKLGVGQRKEPYLKSLGKVDADVAVEISADGNTWKAKLGRSGASLCETPDRPVAWILRREELLKFVNEDPADRYKLLASYISIKEIELSENNLRDEVKTLERSVEAAVKATHQAEEGLKDYWKAEGSPGKDYLTWAKAEATKTTLQLEAAVSAIEPIAQKIDLRKTLSKELVNANTALKTAETGKQAAQKDFDQVAAKSAAGAHALVEVLTKARAFLTQRPTEKDCPVCESKIDGKKVAASIDKRLKSFQDLDSAKTALDLKNAALTKARERSSTALEKVCLAVRFCAQKVKAAKNLATETSQVDWGKYTNLLKSDVAIKSTVVVDEAKAFVAQLNQFEASLKAKLDTERKALNRLTAIQQFYKTLTKKKAEMETSNQILLRAKQVLAIVESRRKVFIDELLAEVSQEVERLYQQIHPNESIGGLNLYLNPTQKGSLMFEGRFATETAVPPQAYYSESHLDTLGICIFLAIVKKLGGPNSFVVLDDLFTSVDQEHLRKIIQLIHDEAESYGHLIITTHFSTLRDSYRFNRAPGHQVQLIELLPWSIGNGIRHSRTKLSVEELQAAIVAEPLDKQAVASKAGILLEGIFDHLTGLYQCHLPKKDDGRYTLGEYFDSCAKLKKFLKTISRPDGGEALEVQLEAKINELAAIQWLRNEVGAHFKLGAGLSNADIKDFGKKVCELAEMVICAECGELPRAKSQGTHWKCRCDKRHLLPLERP